MNDEHNENIDTYLYNPNRPNSTNNNINNTSNNNPNNSSDNPNASTKKVLDTGLKTAAEYYAPGVGGKVYDAAKKVPLVGDKIDETLKNSATILNQIPGVKKASQALDNTQVLDNANNLMNAASPNSLAPNSSTPSIPSESNNSNSSFSSTSSNAFNFNSAVTRPDKPNRYSNASSEITPKLRKNTAFHSTSPEDSSAINKTLINNVEESTSTLENTNINTLDISENSDYSETIEDNNSETNVEGSGNSLIETIFNKKFIPKLLLLAPFYGVFILLLFLLIIISYKDKSSFNSNFYSYNSLCSTGTGGSLASFVASWEGISGDSCTVNGLKGNRAADEHDGAVTVGPGVTNALLGSVTDYIKERNFDKYFRYQNGRYYMNFGDCIPTQVSEELKEYALQAIYGAPIESTALSLGLNLTRYQIDALTSFNYNLGTGYTTSILTAYKEGGLEGLWDKMKQYTKSQGSVLSGLQKRRKGEFALFVTGDYSDQNLFYSRDLSNYDDYNSEGIMDRVNICSNLSSSGLVASANGFMKRIERPGRDNAFFYDQDTTLAYTDYEGECSWYAGHRAREILASVGSSKSWNSMPDGGSYCTVSEVTSGEFQSSKDVNSPRPGSLISWSKGSDYGHVAVVEEVYEDGSILVSEGFVSLGIYGKQARNYINNYPRRENRKKNCEGNGSGCFQTRIISASQIKNAGWSSYKFQCYIYLLD